MFHSYEFVHKYSAKVSNLIDLNAKTDVFLTKCTKKPPAGFYSSRGLRYFYVSFSSLQD